MKPRPTFWLAALVSAAALFLHPALRSQDSQTEVVPPAKGLSARQVVREFRQYRLLTPRAHITQPEISKRCISPSFERDGKPDGLIAHTGVVLYANDRALSAMKDRSGPYPVGSVVVKEKIFDRSRHPVTGLWITEGTKGIGGMIKREPGYDPDHGDWEYFYTEGAERVEAGKISSCIECHAIAKPRDHVFGNWMLYSGLIDSNPAK